MARATSVSVGQRYGSIGSSGAVIAAWEVTAVFESPVDRVLYARLTQIRDQSWQKTLAVEALAERYRCISMRSRPERQ